jgi:hypothetical protein
MERAIVFARLFANASVKIDHDLLLWRCRGRFNEDYRS